MGPLETSLGMGKWPLAEIVKKDTAAALLGRRFIRIGERLSGCDDLGASLISYREKAI
jgi:hypothetical protein